MDWSGAAESDRIKIACILVHDLLNSMSIDHIFMGGFQLVLLGAARMSRDIDVEVCIPGGNASYERIKNAFRARRDLLLFEGAHDLNVRGLWKGCIGLDILIRPGNPPNDVYPVVIEDPRTGATVLLPFMPLTHLLIEKLKCAATRGKWADAHDIIFLTSEDHGIRDELENRGLSIVQACVRTDKNAYEGAMRRHPALVDLLLRMLHVKDAAPNCASALPLGTSAPLPYKGEMLGMMPMLRAEFGRSTSSLSSLSSRSSIYSIESNGSTASSDSDESTYTGAALYEFDQARLRSMGAAGSRTSAMSLRSRGSDGSGSSESSASSVSSGSSLFSRDSSASSATSASSSSSASVHSIEVSCAWPPAPPFFGRGAQNTYRDDYA